MYVFIVFMYMVKIYKDLGPLQIFMEPLFLNLVLISDVAHMWRKTRPFKNKYKFVTTLI